MRKPPKSPAAPHTLNQVIASLQQLRDTYPDSGDQPLIVRRQKSVRKRRRHCVHSTGWSDNANQGRFVCIWLDDFKGQPDSP